MKWRDQALLWGSFLLGVLYVPGILAPATSPRWVLLAIAVPVALLGHRNRLRWTLGHGLGLAFLLWTSLSILWAPQTEEAFGELFNWMLLASIFSLGAARPSIRPAFLGLLGAMWAQSSIAAMQLVGMVPDPSPLQLLDLNSIVQAAPPAGLLLNRNFLGELAALTLIYAATHRLWALAAAPALGLAFSLCRGAWLSVAAAAGVMLYARRPVLVCFLSGLGATVLLFAATTQQDHKSSGIRERILTWSETFSQLTWRGHGPASFYTLYPGYQTATDMVNSRPERAHNELIEGAFNYGLGFALFLALYLVAFARAAPELRPLLVAIAAQSMVGFPLHLPCTAFLGALALGHAFSRPDVELSPQFGRNSRQQCMAPSPS